MVEIKNVMQEKYSLLESVNLLGEEICFQGSKNEKMVSLAKSEKDEEIIKKLNLELEKQLRENKKLHQEHSDKAHNKQDKLKFNLNSGGNGERYFYYYGV